jgi:hypothetical protein
MSVGVVVGWERLARIGAGDGFEREFRRVPGMTPYHTFSNRRRDGTASAMTFPT